MPDISLACPKHGDASEAAIQATGTNAMKIDAASITAATAIKTAMLHHLPLMLLRAFIVPPPRFAVGLSAAVQTGCASGYAQRRASDMSS